MNTPAFRYVAAEFNNFLTDRGLTHREVANACGVTENTVSNIVNGRTQGPRAKVYKKITTGLERLGASRNDINKMLCHVKFTKS